MIGINEFERQIMGLILAGDEPWSAVLSEQSRVAEVISREFTGVGFFTRFSVPPRTPRVDAPGWTGGANLHAEVDGLQYGAGFVLFLKGGLLDTLEGFSYGEPWPDEIGAFRLVRMEKDERGQMKPVQRPAALLARESRD